MAGAALAQRRCTRYTGNRASPSLLSVPYASFAIGFAGSTDAITQGGGANRVYMRGSSLTAWSGIITGTSAVLSATTDFGEADTSFYASVDGGVFLPCPKISASRFQIFIGLSQKPHSVVIQTGSAYGNVGCVLSTNSAVLQVTGAPPSVFIPPSGWTTPFDGSALNAWSAFPNNSPSTNWAPYPIPGPPSVGSGLASMRIRTAGTFLLVTTRSRWIFVGIGAAVTRYDSIVVDGQARQFKIGNLAGVATTYNVWVNNPTLGGSSSLLAIGSDSAFLDVGSKRRLDQFGDSITFGTGGTSSGDSDVPRLASALGMVGGTYGIAGSHIAELAATDLTIYLTGKTIDAVNDVAVLQMGRNDASVVGALMTAGQITDYTTVLNALIARYGKVICRNMIPESTYNWSGWATSINSIITSIGNANIKAAVTTGWTGVATVDGTHPSDAGYTQLAAYAATTYASLV